MEIEGYEEHHLIYAAVLKSLLQIAEENIAAVSFFHSTPYSFYTGISTGNI